MVALTYLEFYSGVGGWGYALERACRSFRAAPASAVPPPAVKRPKLLPSLDGETDGRAGATPKPTPPLPELELRAELLAAYDHSDLANAVFYHNHVDRCASSASSSADASAPSPSTTANEKKTKRKKGEKRKVSKTNERFRPRQTPIERLTVDELASHGAVVWCMSPPCQPHTRQHSNQIGERADPRSKSFRHLCGLLGEMEEGTLPGLILLENVVGFERSSRLADGADGDDGGGDDGAGDGEGRTGPNDERPEGSFDVWRRTLSRRDYAVGHFRLDPTHVGIPNSRPRHYTVAVRRRSDGGGSSRRMPNGGGATSKTAWKLLPSRGGVECDNLLAREDLDEPPVIHDETSLVERGEGSTTQELPPISSFLDADLSPGATNPNPTREEALRIPRKVRESSSAWCFDVVTPRHRLTACFTHSYGKFVRGTGSILYTGPRLSSGGGTPAADGGAAAEDEDGTAANVSTDRFRLQPPEERSFDASWAEGLDWDRHARYFSGTEIARLMGFPVAAPAAAGDADRAEREGEGTGRTFGFPEDVPERQRRKLLGNSLNVRVAGLVAEVGLAAMLREEEPGRDVPGG